MSNRFRGIFNNYRQVRVGTTDNSQKNELIQRKIYY